MKTQKLFENTVASLILVSFVGCNLTFSPTEKNRYDWDTVNTVVSKVIDEQMSYVKDNLDPELQSEIDNGGTKGNSPLTGKEIVELTLNEETGQDYIDFCYNVEESTFSGSYENVIESSREVLPDQQFEFVTRQAEEISKSLYSWGEEAVKGVPIEQQEDFFKDLKKLVTSTVVLMTAGIVYSIMPKAVFWGKVSAAAAISVGAGLVALAAMSLYENYRFDNGSGPGEEGIEKWLEGLIKTPEADYALSTSVVTLATTLGQGSVVTGIMICVFGAFHAYDLISQMMKKYDFSL